MINYAGHQDLIPRDRINECKETICEYYCKWPDEVPTQERLNQHCDECPLERLLDDDWWLHRNEEDD